MSHKLPTIFLILFYSSLSYASSYNCSFRASNRDDKLEQHERWSTINKFNSSEINYLNALLDSYYILRLKNVKLVNIVSGLRKEYISKDELNAKIDDEVIMEFYDKYIFNANEITMIHENNEHCVNFDAIKEYLINYNNRLIETNDELIINYDPEEIEQSYTYILYIILTVMNLIIIALIILVGYKLHRKKKLKSPIVLNSYTPNNDV